MSDRLFGLYRKLPDQGALPDAETLARLAAGEHLGADHDTVLAQVAGSRAAADALAIALATSDNAVALARVLSPREARVDQRPAVAAPSYRRGVPIAWLAAAAAIAVGFALLLNLTAPMQPPTVPVAATSMPSASPEGDAMMRGSFEEGAVVADSFESDSPPDPTSERSDSRPDLFSDDFDA